MFQLCDYIYISLDVEHHLTVFFNLISSLMALIAYVACNVVFDKCPSSLYTNLLNIIVVFK